MESNTFDAHPITPHQMGWLRDLLLIRPSTACIQKVIQLYEALAIIMYSYKL